MKRRRIKHGFNMVEIALALAVLAIGISSILVLFPVGIGANRSAIADNNLADISEFLMGYLRAGCNAEWAKIAADKISSPADTDYFFSSATDMATSLTAVTNTGSETYGDQSGIDPTATAYTGTTNQVADNLYRVASSDMKNSVFLYKQTSGDIVDFAAIVKVWRDTSTDVPFYSRTAADAIQTINPSVSQLRPYTTALCIEISWPAQAPYAQREKRLFRQEIFNQAYRYTY